MPIMAEKDFNCVICGILFKMMFGDLVVPYYLICDDCRDEFSILDEETMRQRLSEQVTREALDAREDIIWRGDPKELVDMIAGQLLK
jgi:hypothetical protein